MRIKAFHTHKKSSVIYKYVQDKFYINPENKSIAIADGTTQSFRSEFWSELLVTEFCKSPTFDVDKFLTFSKELAHKIQSSTPSFSTNPAIASLERKKFNDGSTSTFLGVQFKEQNKIEVISVGDCCLFILKEDGEIITHPFDSIDQMNDNQSFLNTCNVLKDKPDIIEIHHAFLEIGKGDKLLLCTDAISRLFLSEKKWFEQILEYESFDLFIQKIEELWNNNVLEEDDITIIYVSDLINKSKNIVPYEGFSFPEPTPPPPPTFQSVLEENDLNLSQMDQKTIMHNFSCIQNDFIEIKQKQKLHEILLKSILGMLALILLVLLIPIFLDGTSNKDAHIKKDIKTEKQVSKKK